MVFDTLAPFGVEVLDIEQIVLRRRLILGRAGERAARLEGVCATRSSRSPPTWA